jgi:hypothetical protein
MRRFFLIIGSLLFVAGIGIRATAQLGPGPGMWGSAAPVYKAMLYGSSRDNSATFPRFVGPGSGTVITSQGQAQFLLPYRGTIKYMDAHFGGVAASNVYTVTMYDGATPVGTCTVTYPNTSCDTPWTGAYSASQADLISWGISESGGGAVAPYPTITAEIDSSSAQGIWESGTGSSTLNTGTRYFGQITSVATVESNTRIALSTGGTLKHFGAVLYGLTGGNFAMGGRYSTTTTWGSCTVSSAACQDTSGTQAFSAGDYYDNLQTNNSATGAVTANMSGEVDFSGGGTLSAGGAGSASITAASAPWYIGLGLNYSATAEAQAQWPAPFSGNVNNIRILIYTGPGASAGWTFTANYDGTGSGSCTISNTTSTFQTCVIAGPISVTQRHLIDVVAAVQSGTPTTTQMYWTAELQ